MELRMQVEDRFIEELQRSLGYMRSTDVVRDALTILNWAVRESAKGRVILSANSDGHDVARLAMPSLEKLSAYDSRLATAS
jgi:hypothetical protein